MIRYSLKVVLWALAALAACELLLQLTMSRTPQLTLEKDWGVVPVAGSSRFMGKEGFGVTHFFQHRELATPFDDGTISIVVLGDSQTEALQVSDNEKFVSVAETEIRSENGLVNLHNLGRSDNAIPDYIYLAPLIRQYYHPDVVVVQLSSQDFSGENGGDGFNPAHANHFVASPAGSLELHHQAASDSYNKLYNQLRFVIYPLAQNRLSRIMNNISGKRDAAPASQPADPNGSAVLPSARMDEQLKLLQDAYAGTRVVLLLLPFSPSIDKDGISFSSPEYTELLQSAEKAGFVVIDPSSRLDPLAAQGYLPRGFANSLPGEGHMNVLGHRIVGDLLAQKILEILQ